MQTTEPQPHMVARHRLRGAVPALSVLLLAGLTGCAGQAPTAREAGIHSRPAEPVATRRVAIPVGEKVAAIALQQVGVPYRYGGKSPTGGFDCSGLVHYAYLRNGVQVPRTTAGLWSDAATVPAGQMQSGDLLFFSIEGKMSHVGLYIGDGQFVHAPSSGRTVSVESLDSAFYRQALLRAGRVH